MRLKQGDDEVNDEVSISDETDEGERWVESSNEDDSAILETSVDASRCDKSSNLP